MNLFFTFFCWETETSQPSRETETTQAERERERAQETSVASRNTIKVKHDIFVQTFRYHAARGAGRMEKNFYRACHEKRNNIDETISSKTISDKRKAFTSGNTESCIVLLICRQ